MRPTPDVFFGAADRQMEAFIDRDEFDRSFLMSILFQGNLVITDTFFYMSSHLQSLLNQQEKSWLKIALYHGAVLPSFRSECSGSFRANFEEIKNQKIQGPSLDAAERLAQLDDVLIKSSNYRHVRWPERILGEDYLRLCNDVLLVDHDDSDLENEMLRSVFEHARQIIPEAAAKGGGLRRAETYNSITTRFGVSSEHANDAATIIQNIKDPSQQNVAKYLLKWLNYCYQFNQASGAGLSPALNNIDHQDTILTGRLTRQVEHESQDAVELVQSVIEFPSINIMRLIPFRELIAVRNSELGDAYFHALNIWQNAPSESTSKQLLEILNKYVRAIQRLALEHVIGVANPMRYLFINIPFMQVGSSQFIRTIAANLAEDGIPNLGAVSNISKYVTSIFAAIPHEYLSAMKQNNKHMTNAAGVTKTVRLVFKRNERRLEHSNVEPQNNRNSTTDACFASEG